MISKLRDHARDVSHTIAGVNTFSFEDLSETMTKQDVDFTLLHMSTPVTSTVTNVHQPSQDFPVDVWMFDLDDQFNSDERVVAWDKLESMGVEFINAFTADRDIAGLTTNTVEITRGHFQHDDSMIGVQFKFTIRFFDPDYC